MSYMNKIVNSFCLIYGLIFSNLTYGQSAREFSDSLKFYRIETIKARTDAERVHFNNLFNAHLKEALNTLKSSELKYDSIPKIGILNSNDEKVMLINWNLPFEEDNSLQYFGYVIYRNKNSEHVFELIDKGKSILHPETKKLDADNWLGALYYDIVEYGNKKNKKYLLFAWDGNNGYTTKKMIEIMYFDNKPKLHFGDDIFENLSGPGKKYRFIMEYSSEVTATIKFRPKENRIVMDHLSPLQENMEGIYEFYAPDFTYDAFNLEKGKLVFEQNVDVRAAPSGKPFIDPQR